MARARRLMSYPFMVTGAVVLAVAGIWGLIIDLGILAEAAGFWGFVIGFFFFPITFTALPWYTFIVQGDAFPLILGYGGGIIGIAFLGIGGLIRGDD